jgi:hypothetical protein
MTSRSPDSAKDLHVVTFHYRGSRKNGVSLYWLSDPELRINSIVKCAQRVSVFQPINLPRSRSFAAPLMQLRPLQGTTQQGPPVHPVLSRPPNNAPSNSSEEESSCPLPDSPHTLRRESAAPPRENPRTLGFPATLVEFIAPSAHQLKRVYLASAYLTEYVPPSGFRTLSTVCSSLERPALFHAGNAHGVLLFRDFPSQPGPTSSSLQGYPLDVSPRSPTKLTLGLFGAWYIRASRPGAQTNRRLQGFAPVANPYRREDCYIRTRQPIPS